MRGERRMMAFLTQTERRYLRLAWLLMAASVLLPRVCAAEAFRLARDGRALAPIVVPAKAAPELRATAGVLATQLERMCGGPFEVQPGAAQHGIYLATLADHSDAELAALVKASGAAGPESYRLRSSEEGLVIIGASDVAVRHGVWDLLERLGYRQFFPGERWEVVPKQPSATVDVDVLESPDYAFRRIWYSYGTWPENRAAYDAWCQRNRMSGEFDLNTGHAYGGLIRAFQAEFDQHPEYYALVDGQRKVHGEAKLCISNPAVRSLAVKHALQFFAANPNAETVSIDPSDGGGWCECPECAQLGKPSDLALTLANEMARALEKPHPDKFVAMYAYNYHCPPPQIEAHPRVIVNVATSFLKEGLTATQVIEGWKAKGIQQFGIREYYSIIHWDHDLPAQARGSRLDYLTETIPGFHEKGARFLTAEASENWGPNGLGYYVASRMLWNTDASERVEALTNDFLEKSFGDAAGTMREFYALLNGPQRVPLSEDLVGQMYRLLDSARQETTDERVRARLQDLVLYARYLELYRAYKAAPADERLAKLEQVLRHSYRMRTSGMVHSLAQYRTGFRDAQARIPAEVAYRVPEENNAWKSSEPWSEDELERLIRAGIAANPLRPFKEVAFSAELTPATKMLTAGAEKYPPLELSAKGRGTQLFYTWVDKAPQTLKFRVTGGLIKHYRDRGPARLELQTWDGDTGQFATVAAGESAPDGVERTVRLTAKQPGLHRVQISDGSDMTEVLVPEGIAWTMEMSPQTANRLAGRSSYYFYVPPGTEVIGGYLDGADGTLHDPRGKKVATFDGINRYFHVEVPAGESGKLWSVRGLSGSFRLMTVPPYVAASPEELLLPAEVVVERKLR